MQTVQNQQCYSHALCHEEREGCLTNFFLYDDALLSGVFVFMWLKAANQMVVPFWIISSTVYGSTITITKPLHEKRIVAFCLLRRFTLVKEGPRGSLDLCVSHLSSGSWLCMTWERVAVHSSIITSTLIPLYHLWIWPELSVKLRVRVVSFITWDNSSPECEEREEEK